MSAPSWFDNITFNSGSNNEGLLRIDFMSSGMECYYKKISTKEFESGKYTDKFKKNPSLIKEDGMKFILNNSELEYEVDLNGKTIKKLEYLSGKEKLIKLNKNNWSEFLDVEKADYLMVWGHGGVCGYTFKFSNVKKFDSSKLTLNIELFDNGDGIKEYFLGNIEYAEIEPIDAEATFEPKHGYWGPIFYKFEV